MLFRGSDHAGKEKGRDRRDLPHCSGPAGQPFRHVVFVVNSRLRGLRNSCDGPRRLKGEGRQVVGGGLSCLHYFALHFAAL